MSQLSWFFFVGGFQHNAGQRYHSVALEAAAAPVAAEAASQEPGLAKEFGWLVEVLRCFALGFKGFQGVCCRTWRFSGCFLQDLEVFKCFNAASRL